MIQELSGLIKEKEDELKAWYSKKKEGLTLPFYSSFDIRNAGYKTVVVDMNVYPAGFNNLCKESIPIAVEAAKRELSCFKPETVGLIAEFTRNSYYYDNILTIKEILEKAGANVLVGSLDITEETTVESASKGTLSLASARKEGDELLIGKSTPDIIITDNDFSTTGTSPLEGIRQYVTPSTKLGWHRRRKQDHFRIKSEINKEVSEILGIDRWQIGAFFDFVKDVDFMERRNFEEVSRKVDEIIKNVKSKYEQHGIADQPYVFVKGSSSTYGMSVTHFHSGQEFQDINSKTRRKMHKSKGGNVVQEVLIQEGVRTVDKVMEYNAEPVVYCIGDEPIGGFFRAHKEKSEEESLNAPGMTFKPNLFCPSAKESPECFEESNVTYDHIRVYKFLARLGVLAIAMELREQQ